MRLFVFALALAVMTPLTAATIANCTVTSGTVLTATLGGNGYSINNGIGTSTGGATGVISCPSVSNPSGTIINYRVLATADYQGGPFGTVTGTQVTEIFSLVGGDLNGSSVTAIISGGNSSSSVVPVTPLGTPDFPLKVAALANPLYEAFLFLTTASFAGARVSN